MENKYTAVLKDLGFTVTETHVTPLGTTIFYAEIETRSGKLEVCCSDKGTARVDKPNNTYKWYYEKSPVQIKRALVQSLEHWNF